LKNKKLFFSIIVVVFLISSISLFAQTILTAENYFDEVSQRYGQVKDYGASITITRGDTVMKGKLYYKIPNLLRIDFTDPKDQVLVSNGEELTIYIPKYEVIMTQKLKKHSSTALASMASEQGLKLLKKNYSIAYLVGPAPIPLDDKSKEMVVNLKLTSRSVSEGFRQIIISIDKDKLIRRIKGVTTGYDEITFDFIGIKVNQNIPDSRFDYDSPPYANVYNNFLFESQE